MDGTWNYLVFLKISPTISKFINFVVRTTNGKILNFVSMCMFIKITLINFIIKSGRQFYIQTSFLTSQQRLLTTCFTCYFQSAGEKPKIPLTLCIWWNKVRFLEVALQGSFLWETRYFWQISDTPSIHRQCGLYSVFCPTSITNYHRETALAAHRLFISRQVPEK